MLVPFSVQGDNCSPEEVVVHREFCGGGATHHSDVLMGCENVGGVINEVEHRNNAGVGDLLELTIGQIAMLRKRSLKNGSPNWVPE